MIKWREFYKVLVKGLKWIFVGDSEQYVGARFNRLVLTNVK